PGRFAPGEPLPERPFIVGYAGGLIPEKGVDVLIRAVARLSGDWQLRLVGDGTERPRLERLARRLGVADRVAFLPRLVSADMPDFYRQLHVLVLPSRDRPNWREQFGRVLVEAMACGVPVIGSDCGEIPRVVGNAGLVFHQDDVEALRAHLDRLQHEPQWRRRLGQRGRARVLAHFTHDRVAAATVDVYRALNAG
ncbi:MAG: glycosyltransferase family 4 protein, partial [Anaerolineae bacterium]|nr:glycosyltransferase family 4 protein [Anaerolineae bacterium]